MNKDNELNNSSVLEVNWDDAVRVFAASALLQADTLDEPTVTKNNFTTSEFSDCLEISPSDLSSKDKESRGIRHTELICMPT